MSHSLGSMLYAIPRGGETELVKVDTTVRELAEGSGLLLLCCWSGAPISTKSPILHQFTCKRLEISYRQRQWDPILKVLANKSTPNLPYRK